EKRKRRQIEREFGVPIAGEILDPSRWTQTALKKLPAEGTLDPHALFGRCAPLVVDLGCGNGRFLIGSAVWRPDHDHLGVDVLPVVIRYATRRVNQRGLVNLRFAVCDAETFLARVFPPGRAAEVHCYHPQPFYDPAQVWAPKRPCAWRSRCRPRSSTPTAAYASWTRWSAADTRDGEGFPLLRVRFEYCPSRRGSGVFVSSPSLKKGIANADRTPSPG